MMVGFPMLMYYLWICLWFYDGRLVVPTSVDGIEPFIKDMWAHIRDVSSSPFGSEWWPKNLIISPSFPFV
jgi:delta24(24(1))-sterol reductase